MEIQAYCCILTGFTILAQDIRLFLCSRHGVFMSDEQVVERLLKGFSTSTAEDVNELADKTMDPSLQQLIGDIGSDTKLDLVEFVSLLMIPRLQREALDHIDGRASDTISYVFKMLIHDAIDSDDQATVPLSKATLERMFRCFGEVELAQDQDLMQEMINQARTDEDEENHPTTILTADVFARALTKDLGAYDPSLSTDRLAAMLSEPHGHEKRTWRHKAIRNLLILL